MKNLRYANRTFQIWEYTVTHGSLLIRSPRSADAIKNVDIVCIDVEYVAAPRFLRGLVIDEPTSEELQQHRRILGRPLDTSSIIILASSGHRFSVVAASCNVEENEKDIFDSPFN